MIMYKDRESKYKDRESNVNMAKLVWFHVFLGLLGSAVVAFFHNIIRFYGTHFINDVWNGTLCLFILFLIAYFMVWLWKAMDC